MTSDLGKIAVKTDNLKKTFADRAKIFFCRYGSEGKSVGSLQGARSTSQNKTYPTIKIMGYEVI